MGSIELKQTVLANLLPDVFREVECFSIECGEYFLFYNIVFGLFLFKWSSKAAKNNNHEYL